MCKKLNRQPVVVGSKKNLGDGVIEYSCDTIGFQGLNCYKDERAFNKKDGVCYIADEHFVDSDNLVVDPAINNSVGETYQTIYDCIKEECEHDINRFRDFSDAWQHDFIDYMAKKIFDWATGWSIEITINEFDLQEEFDLWLSNLSNIKRSVGKTKVYVLEVENNNEFSTGECVYTNLKDAMQAMREEIKRQKSNGWLAGNHDYTEEQHTERLIVFSDDYNYLSVMVSELEVK